MAEQGVSQSTGNLSEAQEARVREAPREYVSKHGSTVAAALALGVPPASIAIVARQAAAPGNNIIQMLARATGVSVDFLLNGTPDKMRATQAKAEILRIVARLRAHVVHARSLGSDVPDEERSSISEQEMANSLDRFLGNFSY